MGKNNDLARLSAAIRDKNFDRLEELLDGWTCCNYRDSLREESLLHIAHHTGTEMVDFLLRHGVDPNEQDEVGDTVMNYAAAENKVDEIRLLLAHGGLVDLPNVHGEDAFSFACVWDSLEAAQLLFEAGSRMTWIKKNWSRDSLLKRSGSNPTPRIRAFLLDIWREN